MARAPTTLPGRCYTIDVSENPKSRAEDGERSERDCLRFVDFQRQHSTTTMHHGSYTVVQAIDMFWGEDGQVSVLMPLEVVVFARDHALFVFVILSFATVISVPASLARCSPSLDFWREFRAPLLLETRLLRTLREDRTLW